MARSIERWWNITLSDPHCGFRYGLMMEGVVLPPIDTDSDEWTPHLTGTQKWLAKHWEEDRKNIIKLVGKEPCVVTIMGDSVQGNDIGSNWLVSPRMDDQYAIFIHALRPWIESFPGLRAIRMVKGTLWHSGKHGTHENTLARLLQTTFGVDARTWHQWLLTVNGVTFDCAHKGPVPGYRTWLNGDDVRRYVRDIQIKHLTAHMEPPMVVLRGHYHDRIIETVRWFGLDRTVETWGAICPAYSIFKDDYTISATRSKSHMYSGTLLWELDKGRVLACHDFSHVLDLRRKEIIR